MRESAEALALHGDALWSAGLFPEAGGRYRDALAVDPGDARAHHGLARLTMVSRDFDGGARHTIRTAIARQSSEAEFHHTEGYVHERRGNFTDAAASLRNFQNLLPPRDREERALLTRAQVRFLESFEGRTPFAVDEAVGASGALGCRSGSSATRSSSRAASTAAGRSSSSSTPAPR